MRKSVKFNSLIKSLLFSIKSGWDFGEKNNDWFIFCIILWLPLNIQMDKIKSHISPVSYSLLHFLSKYNSVKERSFILFYFLAIISFFFLTLDIIQNVHNLGEKWWWKEGKLKEERGSEWRRKGLFIQS